MELELYQNMLMLIFATTFIMGWVVNKTDFCTMGAVSDWIKSKNIGFGKIMMPLRVALVGALEGVDVFDIVFYIGKNETIDRINALIQHQA